MYELELVIRRVGEVLVNPINVGEESNSDRELFRKVADRVTQEELAKLSFDDLEQTVFEQGSRILKRIYQEYLELREQTEASIKVESECAH